jgi:hypothetical protein
MMNDEEFLQQFESCSLPFEEWTHRAHVKIAFLYLQKLPFQAALDMVRRRIKAYNAAQDVPEGPTSGFNETTTQAFMRLVAATMNAYGAVLPTPDSESFCNTHPQLMSKHVLRLFYSPRRRMRPEAKHQFVEPDLGQLPLLPSRQ